MFSVQQWRSLKFDAYQIDEHEKLKSGHAEPYAKNEGIYRGGGGEDNCDHGLSRKKVAGGKTSHESSWRVKSDNLEKKMTLGTTLLSLVRSRVVAKLKRCGYPILYTLVPNMLYLNLCFFQKKTDGRVCPSLIFL